MEDFGNIQRQETKKILFHYTSYNSAFWYIFRNKKLLINRFKNSSDPLEKKGRFKKSEGFDAKCSDFYRFCCFCKDDSLAQGHHKARMWAQYANNHTGVCLGFNEDILVSTLENTFHLKYKIKPINYKLLEEQTTKLHTTEGVIYSLSESEPLHLYHLLYGHESLPELLFFSKLKDYEHENEKRIVMYIEDNQKILIDIQDSLKYVVFGLNTSVCQKKKLFMRLKKAFPKVMVYQLEIDGFKIVANSSGVSVINEPFSCSESPIFGLDNIS